MPFSFALTNPGLEKSLIAEVHHRFPGWRLAFSAPGFVTFKGDDENWPRPYLARAYGECLGKGEIAGGEVLSIEKAGLWSVRTTTPLPLWKDPAQQSGLSERADAPSRAWLKIEEAIELFGLGIGEGQCVLEVGCAPGGAAWALLNRGCQVIGVDPAEMDPRVTSNPWFTHIKKPFQELTEKDYQGVDWWLSDLNLAPGSVLSHLGRLLRTADKPRGLVLTLKLAKPEVALELAEHEERVRKWGYQTQVRLLPSHHKEVVLIARR
jgi:hypothetical protein